jgi:PAS domain S-box-containing protein
MKILLVSSDPALRCQIQAALSRHHFTVDGATDGEETLGLLHTFIFDMMLLDAALPEQDGISLCRRLREVGNPVLILLMIDPANADIRLRGLDSGADACLEKPIQEPELLAQIRALAWRGTRQASLALAWGPLSLDPVAQQITCHGQVLNTSRKEYQILELLLNHPRQMFSRSDISNRLWTLDEQLPTDATIKSHIRSIRRKLEQAGGAKDLIQTHYGHGYCLNPACAPGNPMPNGGVPESDMPMDSVTANLWQELMAANARLQQEVEQRKQVEARLRRSETLLRTAQKAAQIGSWEFDRITRQTYWTEELYLIHGLDPSQPPPHETEVLSLIHPEDRQLHEEAIRGAALRGESFEVNLRIIRANDGEVRYINARGGPLFDADGNMVKLTGTTFDVTRWVRKQKSYWYRTSSAKI